MGPATRQTWLMSSIMIHVLVQGIDLSFPSSLFPALRSPDSPIALDLTMTSWLASVSFLSSLLGFVFSSFSMDICGRRLAFILALLPSIPGWLLVFFAKNMSMLMIGRILSGISNGGTVTLAAISIGEYSSPKYRRTFLGLKNCSLSVGMMIGHILALYVHWKTIAMIALILQIISLLIATTMPESPAWLLFKNQIENCKETFYWLRGISEESKDELDEMFRGQRERTSKIEMKSSIMEHITDFFKKFTMPDFIKPTAIIFLSSVVIETSGRHVFPAFSLEIIEAITGNRSKSFFYTLCIDTVVIASSLFSSFLVKIIKRRTLLFSCGFGALLVLKTACLYLFLSDMQIIPDNKSWIPSAMLVTFFTLVNLGCTPIPLAILGEIYPMAHKSAGSVMTGVILSTVASIVTKATPYLLSSIKVYGTFAVFGMGMGTALFVLIFILPETKDKTLQEIEDYFVKGKKNLSDKHDKQISVQTKLLQ